jgi:hypothetical protein
MHEPIPGEPDVLPPETGDDHIPHDGTCSVLQQRIRHLEAENEIIRGERDGLLAHESKRDAELCAARATLASYGIVTEPPPHAY